jgi:hypothetical protein
MFQQLAVVSSATEFGGFLHQSDSSPPGTFYGVKDGTQLFLKMFRDLSELTGLFFPR